MYKYDIEYQFEIIDGAEKLVVYIANPDGDLKFPEPPHHITIDTHPNISGTIIYQEHFHFTVFVEENPLGYNSANQLRFESTTYVKSNPRTKKPRYLTIYCVNTTEPNAIKRRRRTKTTVSDSTKDD